MQKIRYPSFQALLLAVACLVAFWPGSGVYAGDARLKEISSDPYMLWSARGAGRKIAAFCANCHGDSGISVLPDVPNLAGQNADYLLEQTRKFGNGQRKDHFMQGMINALQEEEKVQLSLFYASQNPGSGRARATVDTKAGGRLFTASCARCHGDKALGDELIPRLAGQHEAYLVVATIRYHRNSGERQDPRMSASVAPLKDADIKAVAAYLSNLR
ncbi:MAG: c-type cytochrome [Betaproteobacteria bacterium]|nr:c-type cytochrome [Betaproteobacteria bacterium]